MKLKTQAVCPRSIATASRSPFIQMKTLDGLKAVRAFAVKSSARCRFALGPQEPAARAPPARPQLPARPRANHPVRNQERAAALGPQNKQYPRSNGVLLRRHQP